MLANGPERWLHRYHCIVTVWTSIVGVDYRELGNGNRYNGIIWINIFKLVFLNPIWSTCACNYVVHITVLIVIAPFLVLKVSVICRKIRNVKFFSDVNELYYLVTTEGWKMREYDNMIKQYSFIPDNISLVCHDSWLPGGWSVMSSTLHNITGPTIFLPPRGASCLAPWVFFLHWLERQTRVEYWKRGLEGTRLFSFMSPGYIILLCKHSRA